MPKGNGSCLATGVEGACTEPPRPLTPLGVWDPRLWPTDPGAAEWFMALGQREEDFVTQNGTLEPSSAYLLGSGVPACGILAPGITEGTGA